MDLDAQINQLAALQGGVVTRTQASKLGLSDDQIRRRLRIGRWRTNGRGVYRLFEDHEPFADVRSAIAVLPDAVVSHFSAAAFHRFDRIPDGPSSVTVHSRTTHTFPNVTVFRCHDLLDHHVQRIHGTPVTSPSRTVVDLAGVITIGQLGILVDSAQSATNIGLEEVQDVLEDVARRGKPGVSNLRKVLAERIGEPRSGSILERRGIRLLASADLRGFEVEFPTPWNSRRRFDLAFPDDRLAIEWDSRRWHAIEAAFEDDRSRDRAAVVHGWRVLRFTWADVHERPAMVVAVVREALQGPRRSLGG